MLTLACAGFSTGAADVEASTAAAAVVFRTPFGLPNRPANKCSLTIPLHFAMDSVTRVRESTHKVVHMKIQSS